MNLQYISALLLAVFLTTNYSFVHAAPPKSPETECFEQLQYFAKKNPAFKNLDLNQVQKINGPKNSRIKSKPFSVASYTDFLNTFAREIPTLDADIQYYPDQLDQVAGAYKTKRKIHKANRTNTATVVYNDGSKTNIDQTVDIGDGFEYQQQIDGYYIDSRYVTFGRQSRLAFSFPNRDPNPGPYNYFPTGRPVEDMREYVMYTHHLSPEKGGHFLSCELVRMVPQGKYVLKDFKTGEESIEWQNYGGTRMSESNVKTKSVFGNKFRLGEIEYTTNAFTDPNKRLLRFYALNLSYDNGSQFMNPYITLQHFDKAMKDAKNTSQTFLEMRRSFYADLVLNSGLGIANGSYPVPASDPTVKIDKSCTATLFDGDLSGQKITLSNTQANLNTAGITNFDDLTSSIELTGAANCQLLITEDANAGGRCLSFNGPGQIPQSQLAAASFDDVASYIEVGTNVGSCTNPAAFEVPTKKNLAFKLFSEASAQAVAKGNGSSRLAVSPGVTLETLDKIDEIQDPSLRDMLRSAVFPRFGEKHLDLDAPEEDLTEFQKKYKTYPLTLEEKLENVKFVLDEAENLAELKAEDLEYKDLAFGEAVIPVPDKRVRRIWNHEFLTDQLERLNNEKAAALEALGSNPGGEALQHLEDDYAVKFATLLQVEQAFKKAKIEYLDLENKLKYGRIDQPLFEDKTRQIVQDFEDFAQLGSEAKLFKQEDLRAVASRIYQEEIIPETPSSAAANSNRPPLTQIIPWVGALLLMALSLYFGYKALSRLKNKQ